jgi:hypothetical protein
MRLFAVGVIALLSAGCLGSGSAGPTGASSDRHAAVDFSKTVVVISYYARRCPAGARCSLQVKSSTNENPTFVRVTRDLRCDPAGSADYRDPAAACAALRGIVHKLATKTSICQCAASLHPGEKAVGMYEGKQRTIPLDGCSLCNLPGIGGDIALLLPGHA